MDEDLKYSIALSCIRGIGSIRARLLSDTFGSARSAFEADAQALSQIARTGQIILEHRNDASLFERAEREIQFCQEHHIRILKYGEEGYPTRLLDCPDAPALLYYIGKGNLESRHTIGIVGTRNCSQYGRDMVRQLVAELKEAVPDLVINSGLALGIDITAHRAALDNNIPTIGVVAHGLDRIYPAAHRSDATKMIEQGGGIITEYVTGTEPERCNYLIFNNFSFLSTSFFCKIPSLFIIKIIGQFGHIKKSIVNFCKNFQFFSLFSKNVPIWCPFTLPISL